MTTPAEQRRHAPRDQDLRPEGRDRFAQRLGLAITRNLLRARGGEVVLANAEGGGLCTRVSLPRAT